MGKGGYPRNDHTIYKILIKSNVDLCSERDLTMDCISPGELKRATPNPGKVQYDLKGTRHFNINFGPKVSLDPPE